ncbi:MAG: TetR family transcriptional regulator [Proteobacteria bacterium]|nr:TetR family transcriptional regulator [Pseudomonadota bacterium]
MRNSKSAGRQVSDTLAAPAGQSPEVTTIEQIAESADVAAPTVHASFGSKKAIVTEPVKQVRFGRLSEEFARKSRAPMAPSDRIKLIAQFVRNVNDTNADVSQIFLIGKVALPDIIKIEKDRAALRYESQ